MWSEPEELAAIRAETSTSCFVGRGGMACAVHQERVPPQGFAHGAIVQLTVPDAPDAHAFQWPAHRGRLVSHAVLARDDVLRIFEVRERGASTELVQVRMHRLFGEVTGVLRVRTLASQYDGRDRVLLAFADAKLALMEWSDAYGDVHTVSIHTFERAPQLAQGVRPWFVPALRVDPGSQCAALLLPQDALAILPLYQDVSELQLGDEAPSAAQIVAHVPYAPSFVLSLPTDVDAGIRNVRDLLFLPGFQKPTLAVLYEAQLTWTGSLSAAKQTMHVCFVTLDLTVAHYPVTVTSEALPYDCLYLAPCPASLGGVMIVTPSAVLHMDPTARLVGVAVNAWYERASAGLPLPHADVGAPDLQGSQLVFVDATHALLFCADGTARTLRCDVEGRSVTALTLCDAEVPDAAPPCALALGVPGDRVLCASMLGDTRLYAVETLGGERADDDDAAVPAAADTTLDAEELDLYGETSAAPVVRAAAGERQRLRTLDTVVGLCSLNGVAVGDVRGADGDVAPRTVVALHRALGTLEPRLRTSLGASIAPALQVWSAALQHATTLVFGAWEEQCVVYAYDEAGAKAAAAADNDGAEAPRFVAQYAGRTLACAAAPDAQCAVRVTPTHLAYVDATGAARDEALDGGVQHKKVTAACFGGAFLALHWDGGEIEVRRFEGGAYVPMYVPLTATYAGVDVYVDAHGALSAPGHAWLVLTYATGSIELRTLPDGALHWRSRTVGAQPSRLGAADGAPAELDVDVARVAHVRLVTLGDVPTLVVHYAHGAVAVYEACPPAPRKMRDLQPDAAPGALGFVRVDVRMLGAPATALEPCTLGGHACVAVCGEHAVVLVRDRHGGVQWLEAEDAFTAWAPLPGAAWAALVVHADAVRPLRVARVALDGVCAYTRWATGRTYTHVATHDDTGCLVAASAQRTAFVLYNDVSEPVRDATQDPAPPTTTARGALELFARLGEAPVHGYELGASEVVTALHVARLDTRDRRSARRAFVVVGTTTQYGEDRIAKGHMYVFDVVDATPYDPAVRDTMRLVLVCREEMRAPVTALSSLNGYLVAAVGQKLLVRSLEFTEWLVTIAFLETAFCTTSIQRVKNFLLLTDYHRSASFVAFQEEPAQLHVLGRDFARACLSAGGLLIHREKLALVTADLGGVVRLLDYNPANPTSLGGQRLLVRTEYHVGSEVVQALVLPGPRDAASGECFSSEVLLAKRNGAVDVLVPVDDKVLSILQLFQGQLVRSVRHTAGLNPRAFRAVPNVHVARPLTKGILDGALLHAAEAMSRPKLVRLVRDLQTRTGGVEPDDVLRCLAHLQPQW